jgi:hypothetical protein
MNTLQARGSLGLFAGFGIVALVLFGATIASAQVSTGTVNVNTVVVGGTRVPGDFSTQITGTGITNTTGVTGQNGAAVNVTRSTDASGNPIVGFSGAAGQQSVAVNPGTYSITNLGLGSGAAQNYDVSLSPGCSGTIGAGQTANCTVTYTNRAFSDINLTQTPPAGTARVVVTSNVAGGGAVAGDFDVTVTGVGPSLALGMPSNASMITFPSVDTGGTVVTVRPGAYTITGEQRTGFSVAQTGNCSGTIAEGQTAFCLLTYNNLANTGGTGGNTGGTGGTPGLPNTGLGGAAANTALIVLVMSTLAAVGATLGFYALKRS